MSAAAPLLERPEFLLRRPVAGDVPFVTSAWLRGASACEPASLIPRAVFVPRQLARIAAALERAETWVLCHPDDPTELIGFVSLTRGAPLTVHWVYVRNLWRRLGVAGEALDALVPGWRDGPIATSAWSKHGPWLRRKVRLEYDPERVP